MHKTAELSPCRKYRYALWRIWDSQKPYTLFIGLNPSTANETENDPTIRRCIRYAKDWGYGGLIMANLFAYRATDLEEMKKAQDPIGPGNNEWLKKLAQDAGIIIGAWGNHGSYLNRSKGVLEMIPEIQCLKQNAGGEPAHPLYLKTTATQIELKPTADRIE